MTGQLSDFLAASSGRVADRLQPGASDLGLSGSRGPKQLLNAILIALSADDLGPLSTFFDLDPQKRALLETRLDSAFRALDAVGRATNAVALETLDPAARMDLAVGSAEDLFTLARRLALQSVSSLTRQVNSMSASSGAHGTSLSITMHELRRPLTILNSYGQLLSTGMLGILPDSARVAIEGITSSTEQMIQMVSALAELSRLEDPDDQLNVEPLALSEILDAAYEQVSHEAALREIKVERTVPDGLVLHGDRRRLTLATTNILSNAVKHSPDGGSVTVKATMRNSIVHLVISDEGPGFAPEEAAHLFEKYYRSAAERQRKTPGSGLGLYIVKTVAERHSGRVEARSPAGHGAEFELVLPLRPSDK